MANPIGVGRIFGAHFGLESAFAGGGQPSSASAIAPLSGSSIDLQAIDLQGNDESTGSRDQQDRIAGKNQPAAFTIEHYLRLQPDGTTASLVEKIIQSALGGTSARITPTGKSVGSGSTAAVVKVTGGTAFTLFDIVVIEGQAACVTKVSSTQITVSPPLSGVPTTGASISSTRTLHLDQNLPPVWSWFKLDHTVLQCAGGVVNDIKFSGGGSEPIKLTITGQFAQQIATGTSSLSADVATTATTTFSVSSTDAFEVGSIFDIGTETGIVVTAVDPVAGTITVTRGSTPTTHTNGDATVPHWVDASPTGEIAHAKGGRTIRSDSTAQQSYVVTQKTITLTNNATMIIDEEGASYATDFAEGKRDISADITQHFRQNDVSEIRLAQNRTIFSFLSQAVAGSRGIAVFASRMESDPPKISKGDQYDIQRNLVGAVANDADGNVVSDRSLVVATW